MSWWQPAEDDKEPSITIPIGYWGLNCCAVRLMWRDVGLSLEHGVLPGPIQYKLEVRDTEKSDDYILVLDRTQSTEDYAVDYRTFESVRANEIRLTITGAPKGITPGLMNISVFGLWTPEAEG